MADPRPEVVAVANELLADCILIAVSASLLDSASQLASHSLRSLDAIHLASAMISGAGELIAYDRRLLDAAQSGGLRTFAPGARI